MICENGSQVVDTIGYLLRTVHVKAIVIECTAYPSAYEIFRLNVRGQIISIVY